MNAVFVSLAISERYERLAIHQRESFVKFPGVRLLQFDRPADGAPKGITLPWLAYCAKPFAVRQAAKSHDVVVWIDASCRLIADPGPLLYSIAEHGYYVQDNGFKMGQWCSDPALKTLGIAREDSMQIPEISTMVLGLDLRRGDSRSFLDEWCDLAADGVTFMADHTNDIGPAESIGLSQRSVGHVSDDPRVYGHRHDQTAASVLAWRRGWAMIPRPTFADYFSETPDPRTVIVNRG